ncbi:MAG TPA: hypothetical protein VF570_05615, partial [Pyrinomonadaceae bacterium]
LHALVDLTLAVIIFRQVGNLGPSFFLVCICCVFTFTLFPALRDEEFSRPWFPGVWYGGPISGGGAFWVTFALLVLAHLILTGLMVSVVHW